jgi:hypothetical protein
LTCIRHEESYVVGILDAFQIKSWAWTGELIKPPIEQHTAFVQQLQREAHTAFVKRLTCPSLVAGWEAGSDFIIPSTSPTAAVTDSPSAIANGFTSTPSTPSISASSSDQETTNSKKRKLSTPTCDDEAATESDEAATESDGETTTDSSSSDSRKPPSTNGLRCKSNRSATLARNAAKKAKADAIVQANEAKAKAAAKAAKEAKAAEDREAKAAEDREAKAAEDREAKAKAKAKTKAKSGADKAAARVKKQKETKKQEAKNVAYHPRDTMAPAP